MSTIDNGWVKEWLKKKKKKEKIRNREERDQGQDSRVESIFFDRKQAD